MANGWESRLWRLEDKHLREGSSVRQFWRPRPLRIRHRRRRIEDKKSHKTKYVSETPLQIIIIPVIYIDHSENSRPKHHRLRWLMMMADDEDDDDDDDNDDDDDDDDLESHELHGVFSIK